MHRQNGTLQSCAVMAVCMQERVVMTPETSVYVTFTKVVVLVYVMLHSFTIVIRGIRSFFLFICDIIQSICPSSPRILCSGMEPVLGERHRQFRESAPRSHYKLVTSLAKLTYEHGLRYLRLHSIVILPEAKRRPNRNFQNIERMGSYVRSSK